jgi:hypothetical protein
MTDESCYNKTYISHSVFKYFIGSFVYTPATIPALEELAGIIKNTHSTLANTVTSMAGNDIAQFFVEFSRFCNFQCNS